MPAVYTKDEDQAVVITGTVNNLHLLTAVTATIALLQPVAVPASYCLSSAVQAPASITVSAVVTDVGTATALASVTVPVIVANKKSSCYLCSCNLLPLPLQHLLQRCSIYRKHLKLLMLKPVAVPVIATIVQHLFLLLQVVDWHRMISVICASAYLIFYQSTMRAIHTLGKLATLKVCCYMGHYN